VFLLHILEHVGLILVGAHVHDFKKLGATTFLDDTLVSALENWGELLAWRSPLSAEI
jgi:hypothetical protein